MTFIVPSPHAHTMLATHNTNSLVLAREFPKSAYYTAQLLGMGDTSAVVDYRYVPYGSLYGTTIAIPTTQTMGANGLDLGSHVYCIHPMSMSKPRPPGRDLTTRRHLYATSDYHTDEDEDAVCVCSSCSVFRFDSVQYGKYVCTVLHDTPKPLTPTPNTPHGWVASRRDGTRRRTGPARPMGWGRSTASSSAWTSARVC